MTVTLAPTPDLEAVKARQQATWASGDYSRIATLIVPIAERLADTADLRAGSSVLDVATGSGNMAIAAARLGAEVTGIDYVGSLLERAGERAAAERLPVAFCHGDAEDLPFDDGAFDATVSVMGAMFAPDHRRAADEILRVTRPGGTVALASWRPDGFIGAMFGTVAAYVRPPAGLDSPMLWGTKHHLEELFGDEVTWRHRERTFTFRFESAEAFVDLFATSYGPTVKALDAAGPLREPLRRDLGELALMWNRIGGDEAPIAIPATYLESVGVVGGE
jgi:SAM-dependent methyltransferase